MRDLAATVKTKFAVGDVVENAITGQQYIVTNPRDERGRIVVDNGSVYYSETSLNLVKRQKDNTNAQQ